MSVHPLGAKRCAWQHVWLVGLFFIVSFSSHNPPPHPVAFPTPPLFFLILEGPWKPITQQGFLLFDVLNLRSYCFIYLHVSNFCFCVQVSSPHPYLLSPNLLPQSQLSSFQFPQPQVTSPHMPHPQAQLFYQAPATSPSPHLNSPQANPLLFAQSHCPSPQFRIPTQHPAFHQNPNLQLDYSDWNKCESSSELSCFHNDFAFQVRTSWGWHYPS